MEFLEKFGDYSFTKFTAWCQVSYLRHSLYKPLGVTVRACVGRLQEINNDYLKHFLAPDLNANVADGGLISIIVVENSSMYSITLSVIIIIEISSTGNTYEIV